MTDNEKTGKKSLEQTIFEVVTILPHCQALNITAHEIKGTLLTLKLPYDARIVGNPETGVIHGGALTALMDTACGFAALLKLEEFAVCPTIDLRIDYMMAATPGKDVYGSGEIYRMTSNVLFARGVAYHEGDEANPIAHCVATFMRMEKE